MNQTQSISHPDVLFFGALMTIEISRYDNGQLAMQFQDAQGTLRSPSICIVNHPAFAQHMWLRTYDDYKGWLEEGERIGLWKRAGVWTVEGEALVRLLVAVPPLSPAP